MNVWMINHYAIPPSQSGGTRHYVLAKYLVARGHKVTIVASSFDHVSRQETRLEDTARYKLETLDGVDFLWLKTPAYSGNSLARVWNMLVFAWHVWHIPSISKLPTPDVVMGSSPHLFAAFAAQRLAARFSRPFVLEVRDIWPQSLIELGNLSPYHPLIAALAWLERYLYRHARKIVTLLPNAGEHMVSKGAEAKSITWIPNGVDMSLYSSDHLTNQVRQEDIFTVMYAGTHGLANGLDTLLEAAKLLEESGCNDIRFRFVGDGPQKQHLVTRVKQEGITLVDFEEPVSKKEIPAVLSSADALLMVLKNSPVFKWGISPNKLFDYMASARPVIFCVNTPFNPVETRKAGIVVESVTAHAIADGIRRLKSFSLAERQAMGMRGRRYVEENHDLEKLAAKLEGVLLDVQQPAM